MSEATNEDRRARIFTFYSYKGGVGRSMAVANVAALLSSMGRKVLVVDWDLEAPGIERYFEGSDTGQTVSTGADTPGIVDLIHGISSDTPLDWRRCRLLFQPFEQQPANTVIPAGRRDANYLAKMQDIEWARLFREKDLAAYLERLRAEWTEEFDLVLVDSRTGVNDLGGICTIYLPDILIAMFTANRQSVEGVVDVIRRARMARGRLPFDRGLLLAVPVPSRDESRTDYDQATDWRNFFAEELGEFYRDFLPLDVNPQDAVGLLRIPNVPYWSFGERLPVTREYAGDPGGLSYYYSLLARLIDSGLSWGRMLDGPAPRVRGAAAVSLSQTASMDARLTSMLADTERTRRTLNQLMMSMPRNYTEEIELTYTIGEDANGDVVRERHITTPNGYVPFRIFRPTVPPHQRHAKHFSDADFTIVALGGNVRIDIVPLVEVPGMMRGAAVFDPGITQPLEWIVTYRMPGLWDPLRKTGSDEMTYSIGAVAGDATVSPITHLALNFEFPRDVHRFILREHGETGHIQQHLTSGGVGHIHWDFRPVGRIAFRWHLEMERAPSPA